MSQTDENSEPITNMERSKEQASACEPGCSCNAGPSGRARWVVGAIIIVVAGVLIARAMLKSDSGSAQKPAAGFALPQSPPGQQATADSTAQSSDDKSKAAALAAPPAAGDKQEERPVVCGELIRSLGDLNRKAMDKDGVFVFLAGQNAAKNREVATVIEKGVDTLRGRNINMGVFTLKDGSSEYTNIVQQVPPPGVIAMVKGRGASGVSDDVTESKLIQAFVVASSAGGGCCPGGASSPNCK